MTSETTCRALFTPEELIRALPLSARAKLAIDKTREEAKAIIAGNSQKLLVIVGPCSIHDTKAALDYATQLKEYADQYQDELLIIMRVYFEKPRTTIGWRGLINDPHLDGSHDVAHGLTIARELLIQLNELGMPAATEFLDPMTPLYLADLISWGAIGARTTESQLHRQIAAGLPMPIGFKNNTDGNVQVAIEAIQTAQYPHSYLGMTPNGLPSILHTPGNPNCHVILRGSREQTNYGPDDITSTVNGLNAQQLTPRLMIDCSHGNSHKNHLQQIHVADAVVTQLTLGNQAICGIMLESNLVSGKQHLSNNLIYGLSITDACLSLDETAPLLKKLAAATKRNT
ncbi:MAG: 3-deoxy-7-phosphoheptulonate synthase [Gammaproteobacteria bacterium]